MTLELLNGRFWKSICEKLFNALFLPSVGPYMCVYYRCGNSATAATGRIFMKFRVLYFY